MSRFICPPYRGCLSSHITSGYKPQSRPDHEALDFSFSNDYGYPLLSPFLEVPCTVKTLVEHKEITDTETGEKHLRRGYGLRFSATVAEKQVEVLYWHCQPLFPVNEGDTVQPFQIVAYIGNSGYVFSGGKIIEPTIEARVLDPEHPGAHLHMEVTIDGQKVNPLDYISWAADKRQNTFSYYIANLRAAITIFTKAKEALSS